MLVILLLPVLVATFASLYQLLMAELEHQQRGWWSSVQWAVESMTTTGYGEDSHWEHPAMIVFVSSVQIIGVSLTYVSLALIVMPYFEARFEARLPRKAPRLRDYVLVYRWGPAVAALVNELARAKVRSVILAEDETVARRLIDRGYDVVYGELELEDPDPALILRARAIVANGNDQQNGALVLGARQHGFEGEIIALVEQPLRRKPMMLAGATAVYTPLHVLAAAMASLASERISPRVIGIQRVGGYLHTAEMRIHAESELAGKTLAEADIRRRTGATIVGQWRGGEFEAHPTAGTVVDAGAILVAVGSERALDALGDLAKPLQPTGHFVICGVGEVGGKIVQLLSDFGEKVVVVDMVRGEGADVVGDVLDQAVLEQAGVREARALILTLADDSTTLFAATVARDFAPHVPIVARVDRPENVERIHRAGADFALSLGAVAGEILAQRLLGEEWISLEARVKLVKVRANGLEGKNPASARIGELTGCSVVAVARGDDVVVDFPRDFVIRPGDGIWLVGPEQDLERYFERYPGARAD